MCVAKINPTWIGRFRVTSPKNISDVRIAVFCFLDCYRIEIIAPFLAPSLQAGPQPISKIAVVGELARNGTFEQFSSYSHFMTAHFTVPVCAELAMIQSGRQTRKEMRIAFH